MPGKYRVVAGRPLPPEMLAENPDDVAVGAANLRKQLENVRAHGVTPVVAINSMPTDFSSEHAVIAELAASMGVRSAVELSPIGDRLYVRRPGHVDVLVTRTGKRVASFPFRGNGHGRLFPYFGSS